ncbi:MAG TPA: hypothetical protein VFH91_04485 [Pyrinomonadaceae bacterium]|nr:hypothetical protein [Pyrinomonadaceae bacterium]
MTHKGSVRVLLFIGSNLLLLSYKACEEGDAHLSYSCVPVSDASPPFLGFGEWISVGIFLFVVASGVLVSAVMILTQHYRCSVYESIGLQLETHRKM